MRKNTLISTALLLAVALTGFVSQAQAAELKLKKGDHICLVGNSLGERMQHRNHWEADLNQRFPELELVVRNLCFPADEPNLRPRSMNFGTPDAHLKHSEASVILYFFGFSESFAGKKGLPKFTADLTKVVEDTKKQDYGKGNPRVVLVSPIAYEKSDDPNLQAVTVTNENLQLYSKAIEGVAKATGVEFADVFTPTKKLFDASNDTLTLDTVHLNDKGYQKFAPIFNDALFGQTDIKNVRNEKLHAEIADKNFHWWHRYRAANGFSIYGKRGEAGFDGQYNNRIVLERERVVLDQMCELRDARIWKLAQGKPVAAKPDDSKTLAFLETVTNVGGKFEPKGNDQKRGTLDYLTAEEQLKQFKMADGYEISLVASEEQFPELANPLSINFDSKGRLWVAVLPSYPQWQPKDKMDDKLVILEDLDNDGKLDNCKTFLGGLHQPTGFELGHGGVYVANEPDFLFAKDTDGDDKADVTIRTLAGFDSADTHHGLGTFEWGPGGALYFQEGIFKYSQIETPYGAARANEGAVWRYEPRTKKFENFSTFGLTNPWGHVFDKYGQDFITDGTSGQHYHMTGVSGHMEYPKRLEGRRGKGKQYPQFLQKVARPSAGVEFVSSSNFPEDAQGNYLVNNCIGLRGIMQYKLKDDDSSFGGDYLGNLVESETSNFRPVDLQFGPDGALYVCDWHNAIIGHLQHNLRDPSRDHSHGRIWKIQYTGNPLVKPAKIDGASNAELLGLLKIKESRTRYRVRRELAAKDSSELVPALKTWIANIQGEDEASQAALLEGLWVLQSHNAVDEDILKRALRSPDFRVRAAATRVLCYWRDDVKKPLTLLKAQVNDSAPRVRLEALRACSFFKDDEAIEVALEALNHDMDVYLEHCLGQTMRTLEGE
ncbi:MAG: PVC-type heme-binding CxxCH protein [Pirellulales bacterium]